MDRSTFEREMHRAEAMRTAGDQPDYWSGYIRGLRRQFHGEKFGTEGEHAKWMGLADEPTESRAQRGRGYRDGFSFGSDPRIPTTVHLTQSVRIAAQAAAEADGRSLSNWIERLILAATQR